MDSTLRLLNDWQHGFPLCRDPFGVLAGRTGLSRDAVLAALRQIAESQGRQFQAVLDDALRDYIDRQQKERPRRHVMASFASSLDEFDSLYRELAK